MVEGHEFSVLRFQSVFSTKCLNEMQNGSKVSFSLIQRMEYNEFQVKKNVGPK